MTKAKQSEQDEAIARLKETLKPGMTVYTTLRHVSRSGMQRVIDMHVIEDGAPRWIGYTAATAMGDRFDDRKQGIVVGGCGMDMGFHLVYNLSRALFRDAFVCIGEGCPANDHNNAYSTQQQGRCIVCGNVLPKLRKGQPDYQRLNGHRAYRVCSQECQTCDWKHSDGGYALRQGWL